MALDLHLWPISTMKIVIAGAGEVGFHLAKLLSKESQDIVLIDEDKDRLEYAQGHLDVLTVKGDATSIFTMKKANMAKTDLLIAATSSETSNLTVAILGKKMGAKNTVARISNVEFLKYADELDIKGLGIDGMISPDVLASEEIKRLIHRSAFTDAFEFENGKLDLIGIHLEDEATMIDKSVLELAAIEDLEYITVAIQRGDETIIPRKNTVFRRDDHVYFIAPPGGNEQIMRLGGKERVSIKNIMILGGSRVGEKSARQLSKAGYSVKLIEKDAEKCFELSDRLPAVLVINGDCTNVELLEEESVDTMDAFVAVTGNSETNIMSCLVAKTHGVKKTIAMVENVDYIHLSKSIGIDTLINKKLIAANNIFRFIRQGNVINLAGLHGVDAEILEFEVTAGSKITEAPIKDLKFPRSAIIGGVVRDGNGLKTMGDFQILPNDRAVIFCLPEAIEKVSKFFQ